MKNQFEETIENGDSDLFWNMQHFTKNYSIPSREKIKIAHFVHKNTSLMKIWAEKIATYQLWWLLLLVG